MSKQWSNTCQKKMVPPDQLESVVKDLRQQGKTIATLNGSFDLLHAGHLQIIYEASQQADILFLALNTDHSIKQYKSSNRPIIPLKERREMVAALEFVDYVTWFDETDPCHLLSIIQPDVHVNGQEYGKQCIEADTVKKGGGSIHIVKLVPGLSTSDIINKITQLPCA